VTATGTAPGVARSSTPSSTCAGRKTAVGRVTESVFRARSSAAQTEIGGLTGLSASSDPAEHARCFDAVGIGGTQEPQLNRLILTTHPVGHMVRVGGGT